jgi:hypothetical protein
MEQHPGGGEMGEVVRMVDSREGEQTQRFRWGECFNGYTVQDTETGATRGMGDGVDMFCNEDGEECLMPGTQRFYDALNGYFENEQSEIAKGLLRHQSRERGEANIMSTDYDAGLVVGFAIDWNDLKKAVGKPMPEQSHMEDRFDPKTGKPTRREKVVDVEGGMGLFLLGVEVDRVDRVDKGRLADVSFQLLDDLVKLLDKETGVRVTRRRPGWQWLWNEGWDTFALGLTPRRGDLTEIGDMMETAQKGEKVLKSLGLKFKAKDRASVFAWLSIS